MPPKKDDNINLKEQWQELELPLESQLHDVTEFIDLDDIADLPDQLMHDSAALSKTNNQPSKQHPGPSSTTRNPKKARRSNIRPNLTEEELRQRRIERQKRYRQRQKNGELEMQEKLAVTNAAIEAAHKEQAELRIEQTLLPKIAEYCMDTFHAAQSFISNTMTTMRTGIQQQYEHALEGVAWIGIQFFNPTDAQLHAYLDSRTLDDINSGAENVVQRSHQLLVRWEKEPGSREKIEAQLERLQSIRVRCVAYLSKTRIQDTIELARRRIMPTGPNGEPNAKLVEAVDALELTPEQLESFEREWILYLQRTESIRQEARSMISLLTSTGAPETLESLCSNASAGLFLKRIEAVQGLETHPQSETLACIRLGAWGTAELTTQQKVRLLSRCVPYLPDFIQCGRILFGDPDKRVDSLCTTET